MSHYAAFTIITSAPFQGHAKSKQNKYDHCKQILKSVSNFSIMSASIYNIPVSTPPLGHRWLRVARSQWLWWVGHWWATSGLATHSLPEVCYLGYGFDWTFIVISLLHKKKWRSAAPNTCKKQNIDCILFLTIL